MGMEQLEIRWKRCLGEQKEDGISEAIKEIGARRMDGREPVRPSDRKALLLPERATHSAKEAARLSPNWLAASGHAL